MIPLFKPYMPKELPELNSILYSEKLSYGKWGKLFELKIAEYLSNDHVVFLNSFNSAMLVALETMNLKSGDEIIASPMGCLASSQPFVTKGLKVVWADIDPLTGTLDPDDVQKRITKDTKAVFHNHFCGYPGYVDEINSICRKHGIYIVDDAIEAFGSEYGDKKIGNTGSDVTIFSFQTIRLPNTLDGGALIFSNEELYNKAKLIRDYGIDRLKFRDEFGEINPDLDISIPGYGALPGEVNSYIGLRQMDEIDTLLDIQQKNAKIWDNGLNAILDIFEIQSLKFNIKSKPNYWIYGILSENKKDDMIRIRELGYYTSGVHQNNGIYSIFGTKHELKGVSKFNEKFLAIPCGWWMNNDFNMKRNDT